ncbi:MAG: glutamate racemase [Campylobacterota bacterium]|nr:glutamate racemase [Campylobacterota bacterium]
MLKIGVFDSGLGGLTVVEAMTKIIQDAEIYYVADTKNAPYGEKRPEQILQYSLKITEYFIETYHIDALILACNTATAYAIEQIRQNYPSLIIIGTEPGIKPAIEQTLSGKIGVLATPATLQGDKYRKLLDTLSVHKPVEIYQQACAGLVEEIEKGRVNSETIKVLLDGWLTPMREKGVDTIVLGCTHYPLVSQSIEKIMYNNINLIHTGEAISKHLLDLSTQKGHLNEGELFLEIQATGAIQVEIVNTIFNAEQTVNLINLDKK